MRVRTDNTAGVLHQLPGRSEISAFAFKSTETPSVGLVGRHVPEGILPSGAPECGSRAAVKGRSSSWQEVPAPTSDHPDLVSL